MQLATGTYVLVSDGAKALLLQNKGDDGIIDLRVVKALEESTPAAKELSSDRPGRFSTPSGGQAATEQTDWHEVGETRFLAKVAQATLETVTQTSPANLVVAADPKSLGKLRRLLIDSGSIKLLAEINKDLAHQSIPQIEEAITGA